MLDQELMQQQGKQIKEINTYSPKLHLEDVSKRLPMEVPMCNTKDVPYQRPEVVLYRRPQEVDTCCPEDVSIYRSKDILMFSYM